MLLLLACVPRLGAPPLPENPEHDFDEDGFTEQAGDCDDQRADAAPGLVEVCGDGADNDCDGTPNDCVREGRVGVAEVATRMLPGTEGAQFGVSVLDADLDSDGTPELLVSGPLGEGRRGAVYGVYTPWTATTTAVVLATGMEEDEDFGASLTFGDLDKNGVQDLVIGAPLSGETTWGRLEVVYDFPSANTRSLAVNGWDTQLGRHLATLTLEDGSQLVVSGQPNTVWADDTHRGALSFIVGKKNPDLRLVLGVHSEGYLGQGICTADLDGDGLEELAASADRVSTKDTREGLVWILDVAKAPEAYSEVDEIEGVELRGSGDEARFGITLDCLPDLDGDGLEELGVASSTPAAVWVIPRPEAGKIADMAWASAAMDQSDDRAQLSAGDTDGDGLPALIVGNPASDESGTDAGAVLVYEAFGPGAHDLEEPTLFRLAGENPGDALGAALLVIDLEGSPASELVIGAPGWDQAAATDAGAIFLVPGGGL